MKPTVLPGTRYGTKRLMVVLLFSTASICRAQFILTKIGGSTESGNYGTLETTTAFGKDEIGGGSLPVHKIPNIRDAFSATFRLGATPLFCLRRQKR